MVEYLQSLPVGTLIILALTIRYGIVLGVRNTLIRRGIHPTNQSLLGTLFDMTFYAAIFYLYVTLP